MQNRSQALDAVRGAAIGLVVLFHYWPKAVPNGFLGVDLFFVLSGYLIGGILLDSRDRPRFFATFYWRRAFRILPLYLVLVAMATPERLPSWMFLIFGQNIGWTAINAFPTGSDLSVTWSLAIEEQFYLILPALVWFLPRRWLVRVLWACVIAGPLWRYGLRDSVVALTILLPCRLDALMGGVLLACVVRGQVRSRWLWAGLALLAPAIDIALHPGPPYSVVALAFTGGLGLIVSRSPARFTFLRPLSWLGIGAYSIYLFHLPILRLAGSPALALPLTLAMAWVSWRYIEAPLIRLAHRRLSLPMTVAVPRSV